MVGAVARGPMARIRPKTVTTRLDEELVRKANIIAAFRNISAPEYLRSVLEPIVDRDLKEELAKQAKLSEG